VSKGAETRERIVDRAYRLATREGLEGLSLGALATDLGMSKSGLFAHFDSKEDLQLAVLEEAAHRFEEAVVRPALKAPRAVARLERMFDQWLAWGRDPTVPGGCIFVAAGAELDDRPGRPRDFLVGSIKNLLGVIARTARKAIEQGEFGPGVDPEELALHMYSIVVGSHFAQRLLRDPKAEQHARSAFASMMSAARA
jgi:AcrR family transcriptional regulator